MNNLFITHDFTLFPSRQYLLEYYKTIGPENHTILAFLHRSYQEIFKKLTKADVLEFGGGPTIYQLISLARYPVVIIFSEYGDANLNEIDLWLKRKKSAFSWRPFIRQVLELEGVKPDISHIQKRTDEIRKKVIRLIHCDAKSVSPLKKIGTRKFDIVSTHFVAESITDTTRSWANVLRSIIKHVDKDGFLVMSAITGARYYTVGNKNFPAVPVSLENITAALQAEGFTILNTDYIDAEKPEESGYNGIALILAKRT